MKIIAHRANTNGREIEKENCISQINKCIKLGYDVEIDIRVIQNKIFLGHDNAQEVISEDKIFDIKDKCWIHCKNLEAIAFFNKYGDTLNYFWHQKDDFTLTSKGFIWTYPGKNLIEKSIYVMPELNLNIKYFPSLKSKGIAGICTDYPDLIT